MLDEEKGRSLNSSSHVPQTPESSPDSSMTKAGRESNSGGVGGGGGGGGGEGRERERGGGGGGGGREGGRRSEGERGE